MLSSAAHPAGPKEHKDRVQVTKQYENKIDRIENRLASIEQLLRQGQELTSSPRSQRSRDPSSVPNTQDESPAWSLPNSETQGQSTTEIGHRDESTAATNVLEQTLDLDPTIQQDPQLRSALESLRGIVNRAHHDAPGHTSSLDSVSRSQPTHPMTASFTTDLILSLIDRVEKERPSVFHWLSPSLLDTFCRKCRAIFKEGRHSSPIEKLFVYSGLSNTCHFFSSGDGESGGKAFFEHAKTFNYLLLQALDDLPMLTHPSLEATEALLSSASTTIGMCKPSLSWSLISAAARMCQQLGFNRLLHVDPNADPLFQRKVNLFWSVYVMDRNTSLRLGRAPAMHDYDIDTPMLAPSSVYPAGIIALIRCWVEFARVQGKISAQLYGPAASSLTTDERVNIAESLADELTDTHERTVKADLELVPFFAQDKYLKQAEIMIGGKVIIYYSTLTMALYAIPADHPKRSRAITTARQCLREIRRISSMRPDNPYAWTVYCHWVTLHTPLTPFTGIFCNIIANPHDSQEDLQLLADYVASLDPACQLSEGVRKFHQLCNIFLQVAQVYVRVKSQQRARMESDSAAQAVPQGLGPVITEFDEHLSTLGFFGPQTNVTAQDNNGLLNDAASLWDWYSGDVSLDRLLEQDLNDLFEPATGL